MIQFAKDVDAALMRPDAALRADKIMTGFLEVFLQFRIYKNYSFLSKTIHFAKDADAALMRPDAALRTIQMLQFGLGRVRAARGPHPF